MIGPAFAHHESGFVAAVSGSAVVEAVLPIVLLVAVVFALMSIGKRRKKHKRKRKKAKLSGR